MAAVIKIEIQSTGDIGKVKDDVADLGKAAEQSGGGFSSMREIAVGALREIGAMGIGLAVKGLQAVAGAISDGIEDAKANAQIQAQTAAVIKSTGDAAGVSAQHVADYASSLSDAAGKSLFGDDQIQQSTNLLLTFTEIKGKTLDAATAISVDMAQALGGAPKDAAIQLGKALNDPIKGITALTRVGVTFSDEQRAQIQAMQEAGDMAGAQAVILAELNKEFGGSAAAAAAATGGWSEFNGRMGEAKEALGAAVLPLLNMLAGTLNTSILPAVETAAAAFSAWMNDPAVQAGIQQIVDTIMNGLAVAFSFIANTVIPALIGAWHLIQPAIAMVIAAFASGGDSANTLGGVLGDLASVWVALQPVITNVVNAVRAVVMAVFGVVQAFIQAHGAEISAFMQDAWKQIMEIVKIGIALYNAIVPPVLQAIAGFIQAHGTEIVGILTNVWNIIKGVIDAALTLIKGILKAALQLIQGDFSGAWETIQDMAAQFVADLISVIGNAAAGLASAARLGLDAIIGVWNSFTDWAGIGGGIIDGIVSGILDGARNLANAAARAASDALDAAKNALGIASPSKLFAAEVGMPMAEGMAQGLLSGGSLVNRAATTVAASSVSSATTYNTLTFAPRYSGPPREQMDYSFAKSLAGVV